MRATLEQLKAMTGEELIAHWAEGRFPFEWAKGCDRCLTMHRGVADHCHPELIQQVEGIAPLIPIPTNALTIEFLRAHLEELYALRLFYDSLYPPSEETPSPTEALAESCISTELVEKLGRENAGR